MFLTLKSFAMPQRGGLLLLAAATFAAGLTAGALIAPAAVTPWRRSRRGKLCRRPRCAAVIRPKSCA
ncbi:MAG: hypothetical protein ACHP7H_09350 [Hyphomicrobiales bacterium]